jgi:1,4-dihydroxy-2-naphthoyl-CoA synthase
MTPQPDQQQMQSHTGQDGVGAMGHGQMMGGGMMGGGMMGSPCMMRMIFALMDADGDGTVSLEEFQAAHERIFKAMDSNKDGKLTLDEMQKFMHGRR